MSYFRFISIGYACTWVNLCACPYISVRVFLCVCSNKELFLNVLQLGFTEFWFSFVSKFVLQAQHFYILYGTPPPPPTHTHIIHCSTNGFVCGPKKFGRQFVSGRRLQSNTCSSLTNFVQFFSSPMHSTFDLIFLLLNRTNLEQSIKHQY